MSFLNPVNEPVLRFSSTDSDAPQINYNARVAGDVKTVLKACLVVGYGDKSSAGWSIANEVDHVAEFVSPSAAMSDYRLGIDDTSTSSTTWYYQHQGMRVNPIYNTVSKSPTYLDKTKTVPWTLLVTEQGFWFVETMSRQGLSDANAARMIYFGRQKASVADLDKNIAFLTIGYDVSRTWTDTLHQYLGDATRRHHIIANYNSYALVGAMPFSSSIYNTTSADIDLISPIYLWIDNTLLVGQLAGLMMYAPSLRPEIYYTHETVINDRPMLSFLAATPNYNATDIKKYGRCFLIPLDYWEY